MQLSVECSNCHGALPREWANDATEHPCPSCGSIGKIVKVEIQEEVGVELHDNIRAKLKDPAFPSSKNPRVDIFAGDDLRKSDRKWMQKERIIDKDNNKYKEVVIDPNSGETIYHNEEPLTDHYGHGSAKFKSEK